MVFLLCWGSLWLLNMGKLYDAPYAVAIQTVTHLLTDMLSFLLLAWFPKFSDPVLDLGSAPNHTGPDLRLADSFAGPGFQPVDAACEGTVH